jgi:ATP-dependent Lon protease
VERLAKVRAKFGTEFPTAMLDLMLAVDEIDHLTDLVASALLDDCRTKQRLLETLNVTERLDRLVQLLHLQIREFEVMRKLQGDLPNEHVGRN